MLTKPCSVCKEVLPASEFYPHKRMKLGLQPSYLRSDEEYRMLCEALSECVEILSCEKLSLLAHSCGVKISDFYGAPEEVQVVEVIEWKDAA